MKQLLQDRERKDNGCQVENIIKKKKKRKVNRERNRNIYSSGSGEKRPIRRRWENGSFGITTPRVAKKLMVKYVKS